MTRLVNNVKNVGFRMAIVKSRQHVLLQVSLARCNYNSLLGHMLSVDTQRDSINKETKLGLLSLLLPAHETEKCFEFWHICSGNIGALKQLIYLARL